MKITYLFSTLICLFLLSVSVFTQRLNYDSSFTPTINGSVNFVEILDDQKILIAGEFTTVNGITRNKIARLNSDGSLDTSFNANATTIITTSTQSATINSMEVLPDGKILLAGRFGSGSPLEYSKVVVRLNADGSFDNTLTSIPQIRSGSFLYVQKAEQLTNGKIVICGDFTPPNGSPNPYLARYNFDGSYDSTFTTAINNNCNDVEALPDGKYLVAGYYSTVNGSPRVGLTRFNADDSVDTSFTAAPISNSSPTYYRKIELQSDGKIIGFQAVNNSDIASRLNADGSLQVTFPTAFDEPGDVAFQSDGKVIFVGEFGGLFGQSFEFNRFNTDGTHDPSLNRLSFYGAGFPVYPKAIEIAADGKVIVGGNFNQIATNNATVNRPFLARLAPQAIPIKPKFDFDGDGKDDIAVYRPNDRFWYLNRSADGFFATQFGLPQDKPIVADYDGDGKADIAVFRDGVWLWLRSSDSVFAQRVCGQAGDIPQPGYGSDGAAGCLVFRPSDGKFYVQNPFQNAMPADMRNLQPLPTDKPVVADYDGDGRGDLAVFRDGQWLILTSNNLALRQSRFGLAGDKPVPADYDGDGRTDYAVFRPSNGVWYIQKSSEGFYAVNWGLADDLPVPADYDGDGKTDIAVYRNGVWYQLRSANSYHFEQFGLSNDIPAQLR